MRVDNSNQDRVPLHVSRPFLIVVFTLWLFSLVIYFSILETSLNLEIDLQMSSPIVFILLEDVICSFMRDRERDAEMGRGRSGLPTRSLMLVSILEL